MLEGFEVCFVFLFGFFCWGEGKGGGGAERRVFIRRRRDGGGNGICSFEWCGVWEREGSRGEVWSKMGGWW